MAARKRRSQLQSTRDKIKAGNLITRLQKIVDGKVDCQPHQVTAALGLLDRVLPKLKQTELTGDSDNPVVITKITRKIIDPK